VCVIGAERDALNVSLRLQSDRPTTSGDYSLFEKLWGLDLSGFRIVEARLFFPDASMLAEATEGTGVDSV
jgi:hypothetical protein